MNGSRRDQP